MKILILGSFNSGALEHMYLEGFLIQGIKADTFDVMKGLENKSSNYIVSKVASKILKAKKLDLINQNTLQFVGNTKYDVVLVFKGMTLFPETIKALKNNTRLLCCYNPDHPLQYFSKGSGNSNVLESIPYYDIYFSYSKSITEKINNKFNISSATIPFGYPNNLEFSNNNSIVQTQDFFLFVGAYDKQRSSILNSISISNLEIFGDVNWKHKTIFKPDLRKKFQRRKLYGEELGLKIRLAKGVINVLREQNMIEKSHNMRTFEVPGIGGLLISKFTEEQASFFEPGKEALYYNDLEELQDLVLKLEKDKFLADRIKGGAIARCRRENYSYNDRAKQMIAYF